MPRFDGLLTLTETPDRVLQLTCCETDPVARAAARMRRVRTVVAQNPDLAVRIGGRLFVLDQEAKLRQLAQALGLPVPTPVSKPARARRTPSSNSSEAAVAA